MASLKNKDGMGVKRKNSNKASAEASPSNSNVNGYSGEVILANDASVNHIQMIGDFLSNEEAYISQFLSVISQVIEHTHIFRIKHITTYLVSCSAILIPKWDGWLGIILSGQERWSGQGIGQISWLIREKWTNFFVFQQEGYFTLLALEGPSTISIDRREYLCRIESTDIKAFYIYLK